MSQHASTGRQPRGPFQHDPHSRDDHDDADCECPVHADTTPTTAPLGLSFADRVTARPITRETAADVYDAHHAYMAAVPDVNLTHHGLYYQGQLLGAITYRYPLISKKRVKYTADGELAPDHVDDSVPDDVQATASRVLPSTSPDAAVESEVVAGDQFVEAARICLGTRMPNLASCALAASQERFARESSEEFRFLLTFVRADYDAAMVRALRGKGWRCVGVTPPSQASNRPDSDIRERYKWQFLCPTREIETDQADLRGCV